jgi:DNA-binding transcriptional MerR regulator
VSAASELDRGDERHVGEGRMDEADDHRRTGADDASLAASAAPTEIAAGSAEGSQVGSAEIMAAREVEAAEATASKAEPPAKVEYSIDDLAAKTRVPSRTIRFYQSKSLLPKPTMRGRVAFYDEGHVERLKLIEELQDRGLQIRAIADVLARLDKGELAIHEWLGLEDQLKAPWANDRPKLVDADELRSLIDDVRPGRLAELVRAGLVERRGDSFLIASPALLQIGIKLESSGVPLAVAAEASEILRKHLGRAAKELTELFLRRADQGHHERLGEVMTTLRPAALEALRIVFAQEIEREIRAIVESGQAARIASRSKRG